MRLLVTRPEDDAKALVADLEARGHEVILAPLMNVVWRDDVPLDLGHVQAVLLTSANGARAAARHRHAQALVERPAFAVGEATARAAHQAGFVDVTVSGGDVTHLAQSVAATLTPDAGRLLHLAGSVTAGDLAGDLASRGFDVTRAVVYEATAVTQLPEPAHEALKRSALDGVCLYSPRTATLFRGLVDKAGLAKSAQRLVAYCLSDRVADALHGFTLKDCRVARAPTHEAMLALIDDDKPGDSSSPGGDLETV